MGTWFLIGLCKLYKALNSNPYSEEGRKLLSQSTSSQYLQELEAKAIAIMHCSPFHAVNNITARTAKTLGLPEHQGVDCRIQQVQMLSGPFFFFGWVQKIFCTYQVWAEVARGPSTQLSGGAHSASEQHHLELVKSKAGMQEHRPCFSVNQSERQLVSLQFEGTLTNSLGKDLMSLFHPFVWELSTSSKKHRVMQSVL